MAYLRWSSSHWYAFSHVDSGEGDDAVLVAWHERGAGASVTAGELLRAGCEGNLERLRGFMADRFRADESARQAAMKDVEALAPAVDRFFFEVSNAGKIAMPAAVAHRYRELKRLIQSSVNRPGKEQAVDARGFPMWVAWCRQIDAIDRAYPPPRLSREIRELLQARARRALAGESVPPEQDRLEQARIAQASRWPRG